MRMAFVAFNLGCLLSLLGCGGEPEAPPSPLAPRLDAAKALSDPGARDKELVKLAVEAAAAGDATVANGSLDAIGNDALREQTKPKVILRLAKSGKTDPANKLLNSIGDAKTRDRIRLKIRTRDFSE
jgi:hypothetical protein